MIAIRGLKARGPRIDAVFNLLGRPAAVSRQVASQGPLKAANRGFRLYTYQATEREGKMEQEDSPKRPI